MPRGGKREGAGGKPLDGVARVPVSATLSAELVALLDAAAGVSGRSRSMLVNEAVEAYTAALQAIASGAPVEAVEPPTGHGGARPGAGRPPRTVALEVTLPAHVADRLQEAEARTGRPRSALIAGALTVGGYWLEVVGLPPPCRDPVARHVQAEEAEPYRAAGRHAARVEMTLEGLYYNVIEPNAQRLKRHLDARGREAIAEAAEVVGATQAHDTARQGPAQVPGQLPLLPDGAD